MKLPKRLIDYEAVWSSFKLSLCKPSSRVEYLWIYGLADAGGSFELTNLRAIHGKVAAIRPNFTLRKLKMALEDLETNGLLFVWCKNEKRFGHWVGSRVPGRLPPASQRSRFYFVCPEPPKRELEAYNSGFDSRHRLDSGQGRGLNQDLDVDLDVDGIGKGRGIGFGFGAPVTGSQVPLVSEAQGTVAKPATASLSPSIQKQETEKATQPQTIAQAVDVAATANAMPGAGKRKTKAVLERERDRQKRALEEWERNHKTEAS